MKDAATLLATMLVLFSLIALLSADYNRDSTTSVYVDDQETISDVGYRFVLQR
jgi:hypothetical protein